MTEEFTPEQLNFYLESVQMKKIDTKYMGNCFHHDLECEECHLNNPLPRYRNKNVLEMCLRHKIFESLEELSL